MTIHKWAQTKLDQLMRYKRSQGEPWFGGNGDWQHLIGVRVYVAENELPVVEVPGQIPLTCTRWGLEECAIDACVREAQHGKTI